MEKLLIPRIEAAKVLSISVDTLDRLTDNGHVKRVCIGTRAYYETVALTDFLNKLSSRGYISTWEKVKPNA